MKLKFNCGGRRGIGRADFHVCNILSSKVVLPPRKMITQLLV